MSATLSRSPTRLAWPCVRSAALALIFALVGSGSAWSQMVDNPALQNPRRIAEGPDGTVLVSDRSGLVVALDVSSLAPVWGFEVPPGPDPDEPNGAAFGLATMDALVFVGNTETKNVEVYRLYGNNPTKVKFRYNLDDTPVGAMGGFENPIGIAADRNLDQVFVLDGAAKRIKVYDWKGAFLYDFSPADQSGVVLSPVSIAVDEIRQEVLVGDYGDPSGFGFRVRVAPRILIYDYQGTLLFQISGRTAQFARVQGIATNADGRIFAADPIGSLIHVLDRSTGAVLEVFGVEGPTAGLFKAPTDVLLDDTTGDLFVVNSLGVPRVVVVPGAGGL